jgi:hypothetical protein
MHCQYIDPHRHYTLPATQIQRWNNVKSRARAARLCCPVPHGEFVHTLPTKHKSEFVATSFTFYLLQVVPPRAARLSCPAQSGPPCCPVLLGEFVHILCPQNTSRSSSPQILYFLPATGVVPPRAARPCRPVPLGEFVHILCPQNTSRISSPTCFTF